MNKFTKKTIFFILFFIIGILAGINYKLNRKYPYFNGIKHKRIISEYDSLKQKYEQTSKLLKKLKKLSGLEHVSGRGIIIRLADASSKSYAEEKPTKGIIHDEDLLNIVNELWASGARAISINGHRLIINSEIRCAGPTVLINKNRLASPYIIKAIGNKDTLYSSLKIRGGYLEYLQMTKIRVSVSKEENLIIPAYKGALEVTDLHEYQEK